MGTSQRWRLAGGGRRVAGGRVDGGVRRGGGTGDLAEPYCRSAGNVLIFCCPLWHREI
jgi:hypothetical protein